MVSEEKINALIDQRVAARKARNWAEADRVRNVLQEAGIVWRTPRKERSGGEIEKRLDVGANQKYNFKSCTETRVANVG